MKPATKKLLRHLKYLVCLVLFYSPLSIASRSCELLFNESISIVSLRPVGEVVGTEESLSVIHEALQKLDLLIDTAQSGRGPLSGIYNKALSDLNELRKQGQSLVDAHANSQDQVFDFFAMFSRVIDLPKDYLNRIAGFNGQAKKYSRFRTLEFQIHTNEFNQRFGSSDRELARLANMILRKPSESLKSAFKDIAIGKARFPEMDFPFQYQYVFRKGILTLPELFADRESGKVHTGVSFSEYAPYDGRDGDSEAFLRHNLQHAYTQKYNDHLLFLEFDADTINEMIELKEKTNALLKARVSEYQSLADRQLHDAVELIYFVILHDQALTYPIGIAQSLKIAERFAYYRKSVTAVAQKGEYGLEYINVTKDSVARALEWISQRAETDRTTLKREMR